MTSEQEAKDAVVAAALAWRERFPMTETELLASYRPLVNAVDALIAARKPKPRYYRIGCDIYDRLYPKPFATTFTPEGTAQRLVDVLNAAHEREQGGSNG